MSKVSMRCVNLCQGIALLSRHHWTDLLRGRALDAIENLVCEMSHSSGLNVDLVQKSRRDLFPLKPESFHRQNLFLAEETKFHLNELAFSEYCSLRSSQKKSLTRIVPLDIV
jgi:hypothetical protein